MREASREPWREITDELGASLTERGLDLVHPFQVGWYNAELPSGYVHLPDLGRARALGLLIGNTSAFWPLFRRALDAYAHLQSEPNPVDRYTGDAVASALSVLNTEFVVRFAHELEPEPLPIQRIASATGLATLSPSHLSVHPQHGPWIALRAVAVLDMDGPDGPPARCTDHCTPCHKPCVDALQRALARTDATPSKETVERDWQSWVDVRDACPIGKSSRYSDEQIRYHYTKLRELLA